MSVLVFLDTETTGLSLDDDIWEIAAVKRREDGSEADLHLFVEHSAWKCKGLPDAFYTDHCERYPGKCGREDGGALSPREASTALLKFFGDDRPHLVGAVPNFDTERLGIMLRRSFPDARDPWHYHLIDVENLAAGYLAATHNPRHVAPPWDSNALSAAVGVDPERFPRHTAMGDVHWAMAIYDAVMSS